MLTEPGRFQLSLKYTTHDKTRNTMKEVQSLYSYVQMLIARLLYELIVLILGSI